MSRMTATLQISRRGCEAESQVPYCACCHYGGPLVNLFVCAKKCCLMLKLGVSANQHCSQGEDKVSLIFFTL